MIFRGVFVIKNNLRLILAQQKKKMSDVEKDTGLSKGAVRALFYETSKGIQFSTLSTICEYLNCDVGDLLKYSEDQKKAV